MNSWTLNPAADTGAAELHRLAELVSAIGEPRFAQQALQQVRGWLPVGSWSVYQLWADQPPQMHTSASLQPRDTTRDCFAAYHAGLYQCDSSFDAVRRLRGADGAPHSALLLRMQADEAPSAAHRDRIYRQHGLVERLSLAQREADGSVLAVNFYRHAAAGSRRFSDGEVAGVARLAPLLLAAVQRHIGWQACAAPPRTVRQRLVNDCPALTARELDVCERLLGGMSYDGIAADLGVTTATIKTYRARAFDRLGLHFKSELYARFMPPRQ